MSDLATDVRAPAVPPESGRRRPGGRPRRSTLVKVVLLALVAAFGLYLVMALWNSGQHALAVVAAVLLVAVLAVYLRPGGLAAKYIVPGLVFLLVFQVFLIVYTVFIATTNFGDGHNLSKQEALDAVLTGSVTRAAGSPQYPVTVLDRGGVLYLLVTDPATRSAKVGGVGQPLRPAPDATFTGSRATALPGYTTLPLGALLGRQKEVTALAVPVSADPNAGLLKTSDAQFAYEYRSTLVHDPASDTLRDTRSGAVYRDNGRGNFQAADGRVLQPGWRASVGLGNFTRVIGGNLSGALFGVLVWTFAFAISSVVLSFAVGLFLALTFNDPRMRGRRVYRLLTILPYAFPVFLTGLVWSGMLNPQYGFVNQVLLRGAEVPWLQDPWLARFSVIVVSVWFGFPYFFLVCTGALQSIPEEVMQAARVDGAGTWQTLRFVRLPLLLVAVSPLLIAAFAFSFNDFTTIFMLTGGGPPDLGSPINAGATDILITVVYKQAFPVGGSARDYGLASAFSVIIFLVVAVISIYLFRRTQSLEEVHR